MPAPSNAINVCVRVRPLSFTERVNDNGVAVQAQADGKSVSVADAAKGTESSFAVDEVFGERHDQGAVYDAVGRQCLEHAWEGFNATIFAYGQTGSGKTHTMMGGEAEVAGVIPRLCRDLFERIGGCGHKCVVQVSYVEIYGQSEALGDLLLAEVPAGQKPPPLKVRQQKGAGFAVQGLTKYQPSNAMQMEMFIRAGSDRRSTAGTAMNDTSSRSHAVFTVELTQYLGGAGKTVRRTSAMNLVDLAGSENINKSGATGTRQMEAVAINSALSTLRRVLDALVKQSESKSGKAQFIPFRDSTLTKLLSNSIGGNSRTTMIATVSPSDYNSAESKSTLVWACKARRIRNKAVRNERNDKLKLQSLEDEVNTLREMLQALESSPKKSGVADEKQLRAMRGQLAEREKALQDEVDQLKQREEDLLRSEAETAERLTSMKGQYEESQHNLGNARMAYRGLGKALASTMAEASEKDALLKELRSKLERFAKADDLDEREKVVRQKEIDCGVVEEIRPILEAEKLEVEETLRRARNLDAELQERERTVSEREAKVERREQQLIERDRAQRSMGDPGRGGDQGRGGSRGDGRGVAGGTSSGALRRDMRASSGRSAGAIPSRRGGTSFVIGGRGY